MANGSFDNDFASFLGPGVKAEQEQLKADLRDNIQLGKQLADVLGKIGGGKGLSAGVQAQGSLSTIGTAAKAAAEESKRIKAQMLADERELTRLIKIEERERAKAVRDSIRQANKEKAESDREYIAQWKRLLSEREREEKAANKRMAEDAKRAAKAAMDAVDPTSLKAMSARLEGLREGYSRLTAAERENAQVGGVVLARIKELDAALKKSDAEQGRFTRNVGNYASAYSGLGFAVRNIASELPNLGISFRTFGQSISNNIGPLTEAITQLRAQNKALAAEGKPTVSVGKQIAQSFFTWQTAILLVVVAGLKLVDMVQKGSKATQEAEKANKKYEESLKSISENQKASANEEIIRLRLLVNAATDVTASTQKRKHAVDELQRLYPNYLGNISDEAIMSGKAAGAVRELTSAILANALAKANAEKYAAAYNRLTDLYPIQARAELDLQKAQEARDLEARLNSSSNAPTVGRGANIANSAQGAYDAAKSNLEEIKRQVKAANQEVLRFAIAAQNAAASVPDLLTKPTAETKGKAPFDYTNEELKAATDLTEALFEQFKQRSEQSAKEQLAIAVDETNNLERRAEAYDNYTMNRLNTVGAEAAAEQSIIQTKLDKIAEIEKKSADKRTNEEKNLVLSKEALQVQLVTATERFEAERTDIVAENVRLQTALIKQYGAEAKAALTTEQKNFNSVGEFFKGSRGQSTTLQEQEANENAARQRRDFEAQQTIRIEQELLGIVIDANRAKIDAIDQEIAKIKQLGEVQRAEILKSGKTEKEQKELLEALDARIANDEFQLNERKRQQQQRNARFEKAANIALLIQETAIAVVRALGSKPYTPANVALAIGVGALGAAQIARAAATPIPEYAEGTPEGGHPQAGYAWVGDGGRKEVIETEHGTFLTPAVPTKVFLHKGAVVHKSVEDYINKAQKLSLNSIPMLRHYDERISTKKMEGKLDRIARGIESLNQKDAVNLTMIGSGWNNYISDIYH